MRVGALPDRRVYHPMSAHRVSGLLNYEITHDTLTGRSMTGITRATVPGEGTGTPGSCAPIERENPSRRKRRRSEEPDMNTAPYPGGSRAGHAGRAKSGRVVRHSGQTVLTASSSGIAGATWATP